MKKSQFRTCVALAILILSGCGKRRETVEKAAPCVPACDSATCTSSTTMTSVPLTFATGGSMTSGPSHPKKKAQSAGPPQPVWDVDHEETRWQASCPSNYWVVQEFFNGDTIRANPMGNVDEFERNDSEIKFYCEPKAPLPQAPDLTDEGKKP